ncbi:MAG: FGGY-family carbohydrate kinase, partial [Gammaproteobacteria bacterium]
APAAMVAVIESVVFLIQANVDLMCAANPGVDRIQVTGGLANLDGLCQRLADLSGLSVHRPVQVEATARGIAWQAAGCPANWPASGPGKTFEPEGNAALEKRYRRFLAALN